MSVHSLCSTVTPSGKKNQCVECVASSHQFRCSQEGLAPFGPSKSLSS